MSGFPLGQVTSSKVIQRVAGAGVGTEVLSDGIATGQCEGVLVRLLLHQPGGGISPAPSAKVTVYKGPPGTNPPVPVHVCDAPATPLSDGELSQIRIDLQETRDPEYHLGIEANIGIDIIVIADSYQCRDLTPDAVTADEFTLDCAVLCAQ